MYAYLGPKLYFFVLKYFISPNSPSSKTPEAGRIGQK
jgi:hypothetical protein